MWELIRENPVAGVIAACEVGLWVLVGAGLVLRYLLRLRRTSTLVLAAIPLLDVVLVVAVALDLHRGTPAGLIHGLGAVYLGFSVAFGPALVRWADVRFAHRFAGGPPPARVPKHGPERRRHLWREWYRVVNAAAIASAALLGLALVFAEEDQAATLYWWIGRCWVVVGIWFVAGPWWESGDDPTSVPHQEIWRIIRRPRSLPAALPIHPSTTRYEGGSAPCRQKPGSTDLRTEFPARDTSETPPPATTSHRRR